MIPFIDLQAQQARIADDVRRRMDAVLQHGRYIMGPEIAELEAALADFAGAKHAVGCSSGTDALVMVLMAHGVGPGDAVFTTPFTFIATAEAIALLGATPVFVDVDPHTFNIDPSELDRAIRAVEANDDSLHPLPRRTGPLTPRGVVTVDLFGLPADYGRILPLAEDRGLFVLEDAAQSFGGAYRGRRCCGLGVEAATSFFPAKPLGCYGDGGAVFTDSDEMRELLVSIRVHGQGADKYDNERIGLNARLDALQAAVLLAKMAIFEDEVGLRQEVAGRYAAMLGETEGVTLQAVPDDCLSAWAQYSILVDDRDGLQAALGEANVPTAIYYPKPLHVQQAFAYLGYAAEAMPASMDLARRIIALPMHPYLTAEQQETICSAVAGAMA
jgi:dTDP-4-amino-4,6-dideoxygalactose transaminase